MLTTKPPELSNGCVPVADGFAALFKTPVAFGRKPVAERHRLITLACQPLALRPKLGVLRQQPVSLSASLIARLDQLLVLGHQRAVLTRQGLSLCLGTVAQPQRSIPLSRRPIPFLIHPPRRGHHSIAVGNRSPGPSKRLVALFKQPFALREDVIVRPDQPVAFGDSCIPLRQRTSQALFSPGKAQTLGR